MISEKAAHWAECNRTYLMASIQIVMEELSINLSDKSSGHTNMPNQAMFENLNAVRKELSKPAAIDIIVEKLSLSSFEKNCLLVCAGVELNSDYSHYIASLQGHENLIHPSFNLLLAGLQGSHWDAISPASSLRKWNLIHMENGPLLAKKTLRIDEGILHYLTGFNYLESHISSIIKPIVDSFTLSASQMELVAIISENYWKRNSDLNIIELAGDNGDDKLAAAKAICNRLDHTLYRIDALSIPQQINDIIQLTMLWNRQAMLNDFGLFIDCARLETEQKQQHQALIHFVENIVGLVIVDRPSKERSLSHFSDRYNLEKPTQDEQHLLWLNALKGPYSNPKIIKHLVDHFNLSAVTIMNAANEVNANFPEQEGLGNLDFEKLGSNLWSVCCKYTRPILDNLAQRMPVLADWNDIVLSEDNLSTLKEIAMHVKYRSKVYKEGKFDQKMSRGLGISVLFSGESGTGKTMAAEVIANELKLDLFRIDLSQVVNKYIGETEKNLKRIFDAAEEGGAILLFDEADALFGKRSEVKDSHDRYSNIQVGYLLQRMENFNGLAILTTNMKNALDKAFERRLRFSLHFERPDVIQRRLIWKKAFPNPEWVNGVDYDKLAMLNMPGGNIKNIAMNAAFLAASDETQINMQHLLKATRSEYRKLDRQLSNQEVRDWA